MLMKAQSAGVKFWNFVKVTGWDLSIIIIIDFVHDKIS